MAGPEEQEPEELSSTGSLRRHERKFRHGINPRHREIMRRLAMGERQCDIARDMQITQSALSFLVNSPLFQAELHKMVSQVDEDTYNAMRELRKIRKEAVEALFDSVTQEDLPVLRFHAARDILNRTGVSTPKEYHVTKEQRSYEELLQQVRIKYTEDSEHRRVSADDDEDEED